MLFLRQKKAAVKEIQQQEKVKFQIELQFCSRAYRCLRDRILKENLLVSQKRP